MRCLETEKLSRDDVIAWSGSCRSSHMTSSLNCCCCKQEIWNVVSIVSFAGRDKRKSKKKRKCCDYRRELIISSGGETDYGSAFILHAYIGISCLSRLFFCDITMIASALFSVSGSHGYGYRTSMMTGAYSVALRKSLFMVIRLCTLQQLTSIGNEATRRWSYRHHYLIVPLAKDNQSYSIQFWMAQSQLKELKLSLTSMICCFISAT